MKEQKFTKFVHVVTCPALEEPTLTSDWCCMTCVLSLQSDFKNEKPLLQKYVEERGHICLFLPKFHCELNPIEMYWGYAKYCKLEPVLFVF